MPQRLHEYWQAADFNFSYNLTRNYPFKSFRWIAIAVMVTLFAFFSVFNLATIGYDLQPTTSMNPKGTEDQRQWFNNKVFSWGDDSLTPKCQSVEIGIGQQFLTSNHGSVFTVTGIFGPCNNGTSESNTQCPSVSYKHQTLEYCRINRVQIFLKKTDESRRGVNSEWSSWAFSTAAAQAQCNITNDQGNFTIAFETSFPGKSKVFTNLAIDDFNRSASLWWGSRLMDTYFNGIQTVTTLGPTNGTAKWEEFASGQINLNTNTTSSIRGTDLFHTYFFFYQLGGVVINPEITGHTTNHSSDQNFYNDPSFEISPTLTESLFFSKVFYSHVLTDLGQSDLPNLLLDEPSLRYALAPPDDFNRVRGGPLYNHSAGFNWFRSNAITPPGLFPANETNSIAMPDAYDIIGGNLGTRPATMYFQYGCSVPVRKGTTTILMLVLINNFVLMNVGWVILKFVADKVVTGRDPTAMYCDGCRRQQIHGVDIALLAPGKSLDDDDDADSRSSVRSASPPASPLPVPVTATAK